MSSAGANVYREDTQYVSRWTIPFAIHMIMAAITGALTLIVGSSVVLLNHVEIGAIQTALAAHQSIPTVLLSHVGLLIVLFASMVFTGIIIGRSVRAIYIIRSWQQYIRGFQRDMAQRLAGRDRLTACGFMPRARVTQPDDTSLAHEEPLPVVFARQSRLLLIGDDGTGKTVALWQYGQALAQTTRILAMVSDRQMLPIVISLPAYAQAEPDESGLRVAFIAEIVRSYGAKSLAQRIPTLLRQGKIMLLMDGLDEIPSGQLEQVVRELDTGLRQTYQQTRIIITCRSSVYTSIAEYLPLLRFLPQAAMMPLQQQSLTAMIQTASKQGHIGMTPAQMISAAIEEHRLGNIYSRPATIAMLFDVLPSYQSIPQSRGQLFQAYEELAMNRAAITPDHIESVRKALGYLAIAYKITGLHELTGARVWSERSAIRGLVADSAATNPLANRQGKQMLDLSEQELTEAIERAVSTGILERSQTQMSLRFRHSLLLSFAAARYLERYDNGLGRLSPLLLRSEWTDVVILWSEQTADPSGLSQRLARLAKTPAAAATTARLGSLARGETMALALALSAAIVGLAEPIMHGNEQSADAAQHHLRDQFDAVLSYCSKGERLAEERQNELIRALRMCEEASGSELSPTLTRLMTTPGTNRLLRAQIVQVLGMLASPDSLLALTTLLLEPDPIVRESLQRGFHLAGASAVNSLLQMLAASSSDETIHRRSLEAIAAVGIPAVPVVLHILADKQSSMRVAAAESLGVLHDRQATEPLLSAIEEPSLAVRVAAIHALGRLGDLRAQPALMKLIATGNDEIRIAAIEALGSLRSDRASELLITQLDDRNPRIRAAAAESLGHLGDPRAVEPLRKRLSDRDAWAQASAATALRALGQRV